MADKYAKGAPRRDAYRSWHKLSKHAPKDAYGLDIDYVMMQFDDDPIKGVIDFKRPGESVTRTEQTVYDELEEMDIPVYIVTFFGDFDTEKFDSNDHPDYNYHERVSMEDEDIEAIKIRRWNTEEVKFMSEVEEYWSWEEQVRNKK